MDHGAPRMNRVQAWVYDPVNQLALGATVEGFAAEEGLLLPAIMGGGLRVELFGEVKEIVGAEFAAFLALEFVLGFFLIRQFLRWRFGVV